MNKVQTNVLEELIVARLKENEDNITITILEALDCSENGLSDAIMELLEDGKYIKSSDLTLSLHSIEEILEYAEDKELTLEFGFGSVLESYVVSEIGGLLKVDLIEWI